MPKKSDQLKKEELCEEMKSELVLDSSYQHVDQCTKQVKTEGVLSRRSFLQMSGLATAAGLTEAMSRKAEAMIPFGFFRKGIAATPYVDDVFSAYTYTGNGGTQTITNGIDLAGKGGLVWIKVRNTADHHRLVDTARGANYNLITSSTGSSGLYPSSVTSLNSNGFSLGTDTAVNGIFNYVSWTFRKAAKFFDIVTYTGTGTTQTISHSLNSTVGILIIKRKESNGNWSTFARDSGGAGATTYSYFNTAAGLNLSNAAAATGASVEGLGYITSTGFKPNELSGSGGVGNVDNINDSGVTYIAYLFAHDTFKWELHLQVALLLLPTSSLPKLVSAKSAVTQVMELLHKLLIVDSPPEQDLFLSSALMTREIGTFGILPVE
jgi:hypothetical protein